LAKPGVRLKIKAVEIVSARVLAEDPAAHLAWAHGLVRDWFLAKFGLPSAPMTVSYDPADADNGYTGSSSTPIGLSVAYTYDGNQNLTFDGNNTLTYDAENRLIQAQNLAWGTS
jgi:hypothetical protein